MSDYGYYVSSIAEPRISQAECFHADTALCPQHGGLIATHPTQHDHDGKVFYCPTGGMYWRYKARRHEGMQALNWKWRFS